MSGIRVFWLAPTGLHRTALHRWSHTSPCTASQHGHHASLHVGDFDTHQDMPRREDLRWAMTCPCGYVFAEDDDRSQGSALVYRRADTGAEVMLGSAPIGAMWDASWFAGSSHHRPGPDGIHLCVQTPGGAWEVDGRASNCTMPSDDTHRCWVRHGDPRQSEMHVDKNGNTCAAGAGSIISGGWHGFLHNNELVPC